MTLLAHTLQLECPAGALCLLVAVFVPVGVHLPQHIQGVVDRTGI
jgi:hypothetical protein